MKNYTKKKISNLTNFNKITHANTYQIVVNIILKNQSKIKDLTDFYLHNMCCSIAKRRSGRKLVTEIYFSEGAKENKMFLCVCMYVHVYIIHIRIYQSPELFDFIEYRHHHYQRSISLLQFSSYKL